MIKQISFQDYINLKIQQTKTVKEVSLSLSSAIPQAASLAIFWVLPSPVAKYMPSIENLQELRRKNKVNKKKEIIII